MILGFATGFLASLLGWQINLIAIHRGIRRGRTAAFSIGLGATLADILILFAAFAGASPFLQHHHFLAQLKWVGIVTIILISLKILFHKTKFDVDPAPKKRNPHKHFLLGLVLVLGNPAIYILWIGVIGFILTHFPSAHVRGFRHMFLSGFIAGALSWFVFLALALLPRIKTMGENQFHWISRISAVFLLLLALILIFEKF